MRGIVIGSRCPATTVRAGRLVVRIFAPDGSMLVESQAVGAGWHWDIGSAQAGSYRVEVDPVADYAGSVTVRVTDLSDVQLTNLVDESDSVLDLQPGQNGQVRFTATEGTRYRVSVPATTVRAGRLVVRIFAPDESMLVETQALFDGWHWDIASAQAGTYRVEVDPVGDYAGSVTVRVTDLSDVQLTNLVDESDSVLDLQPGQNGQVRFTATEGTRYRVSVPATTVRAGRLVVRIFAPDGSMLVETQALFDGWHWDIGSAQAGIYRVEVDPVGDYAGSVTVQRGPQLMRRPPGAPSTFGPDAAMAPHYESAAEQHVAVPDHEF